MKIHQGRIVTNDRQAEHCYRLTIDLDVPVPAVPGQFCQLRVSRGATDPLLNRPLSIAGMSGRRLTFFYQATGRGTTALAGFRPGEALPLLGPLGRGYPETGDRLVIVGGGLGAAGLLFLAAAGAPAGRTSVLLGGRTAAHLALEEEFRRLGLPVECATDDGSRGRRGPVGDLLAAHLDAGNGGETICACGPPAMLQAIGRLAGPGRKLYVSLEMMMACGFGVCRGCVVPTTGGYRSACTDGPVFRAAEILWDEYAGCA